MPPYKGNVFDDSVNTELMRVCKCVIPYLDRDVQRNVAVGLKVLELVNTMNNYADTSPLAAEFSLARQGNWQEDLLRDVRASLSPEKANMVDLFIKFQQFKPLFGMGGNTPFGNMFGGGSSSTSSSNPFNGSGPSSDATPFDSPNPFDIDDNSWQDTESQSQSSFPFPFSVPNTHTTHSPESSSEPTHIVPPPGTPLFAEGDDYIRPDEGNDYFQPEPPPQPTPSSTRPNSGPSPDGLLQALSPMLDDNQKQMLTLLSTFMNNNNNNNNNQNNQ